MIIQPMINSLLILYSIAISNFGLAIILFTVLIRAAMMPLTVKQSKQMKSMTALQPKIKEIQNKFNCFIIPPFSSVKNLVSKNIIIPFIIMENLNSRERSE